MTYGGWDPNTEEDEYSGDIEIPESVTYNNTEYSVTSIGALAFTACSNLTSIYIPHSVSYIGLGAFQLCSSLTSINIPNTVTGIEEGTFLGCTALKDITIPNSVTYIGERAFNSCQSLEEVSIPNSVTEISGLAFCACESLTSVNIPNSVTYIGILAFGACYSLRSLSIPKSVIEIGSKAFSGAGMTSIVVEEGNPNYDSRENCNAIIETATNKLLYGCQNSFIPNSVTSIGEEAFFQCWGLTNIEIPTSVTSIGIRAFSYTGLTSIEIPNSITTIENEVFFECVYLRSITIPNSVTSIEASNFVSCKALESITIPNSVTYIGSGAFSNCYNLRSLNLSNSLTYIGAYAFGDCDLSDTDLTIPNSVTYIGDAAFINCNMKSLYIPNSVTYIGDAAFRLSGQMTSIVVEECNPNYDSRENCNAIIEIATNKLLVGCQNSFIPNSVTSIAQDAFGYSYNLESIIIPSSVTSIGNHPFRGCIDLRSIIVEDGNPVYDSRENCNAIIETATNNLISGCSNSFIPNSVTTISDRAFFNLHLYSITIPKSVTSIGEWAFDGDPSQEINCISEVPPVTNDPFLDYSAVLNVPIGCADAYRNAEGWCNFVNINEVEFSGIENIIEDNEIDVSSDGKTINIDGINESSLIEVFDMNGVLIYQGYDKNISMPSSGLYIVKIGSITQKIFVN